MPQLSEDTVLALEASITSENVIVGILNLLIEKGIVTKHEVRLMIEGRAAAANYNIEGTGFDRETTKPVEELVANTMNRIAARFE